VQQIKFDFNSFMVPAIHARLPAPWKYNLENDKSQDMLDRKIGICPKIREFYRPIWGTERIIKTSALEKNLHLQLVKGNPLLYINGMKNQQTGDADE